MRISKGELADLRAKEVCLYMVQTQCTIREAADEFKLSKETICKYTRRINEIDYTLYLKIRELIDYNKSQRGLRGGASTKKKYIELREYIQWKN